MSNLVKELEDLIESYEDQEDCWDFSVLDWLNRNGFNEIKRVYHDHEQEGDVYMKHIFSYKGSTFSVIVNGNSYGDSGYEWGTLKEVKAIEKTIVVYE